MKKIILCIVLIFFGLTANALTINKLLNYYKNQPDIQYEVIKGKRLSALVDSVSSDVEKDALRSAKKLVVFGSFMDEEQRKDLSSRLDMLDDYSLAFSYSLETPESTLPLLFAATGMESSTKVDIYAKNSSSSEYIYQPVFLINMWGMVALAYLDGKIKPDATKDLVKATFKVNYSTSVDETKQKEERSILDRLD
ncbi:MAG: hypothetical protein K2K32_05150, partial [Muribaculaceae bacterium]|nr:hypothetical protein [Muribaculaceae bacterium]